MKDRLIDLLIKWGNEGNDGVMAESVADHLLKNGVIVPPCNIGDVVYRIVDDIEPHITKDYVARIVNYGTEWAVVLISDRYIPFSDFGKTVFLTKEEAEQALKERKRGK